MKKLTVQITFLLLCTFHAFGQQQAKIMTYNILNYESIDTARNVYFRTIINSARPDILVTQENTSATGVSIFLNQIMKAVNPVYAAGVFIDSTDTDNAVFFDSLKFRFISNTVIRTNLRTINEFKLIHKSTGDTLRIFSCHLKANSGTANENLRAAEADSLRKYTNALPFGTAFIACGDFNIYGSYEPAYQKLTQTGSGDGKFNDPLTMTGIWNDSNYKSYHTQSTRTRSFGYGATGGLDDRFDMILYSNSIKNNGRITFTAGSLTPYGNDGHHYNDSINKIPNTAVSQTTANALHYGSDHLPVYAVFNFFPQATNLSLTAAFEGYLNAFNLRMNIKDTVKVLLRNIFPPYEIKDSSVSVIDSVTYEGNFRFSNIYTGNYYIVVKGRNIIETWSKAGGETINAGSNINYNFTESSSKAYGENMVLKAGKYCLFSGDVNQDGAADAGDLSQVENSAANSLTGYISDDLNGDYFTDAEDISIVENNSSAGVISVTP